MKLNLKKMISQRKSAFKQYGEITEMNTELQTELKEIKRTGFTNKDMLNTLLGQVNFQVPSLLVGLSSPWGPDNLSEGIFIGVKRNVTSN